MLGVVYKFLEPHSVQSGVCCFNQHEEIKTNDFVYEKDFVKFCLNIDRIKFPIFI
jgi:hypothetical protein